MKNQKKCFLTIIVLLCILFLSSGCHTGRLNKTSIRRSSVSTRTISHSDSLSFAQQLQATSRQKLRLEHIELSPPDSLQRQYICSVTRLERDKEIEELTAISGKINKEENISVNKKEKVITNKVKKASLSFWWGSIVLLVVGWVLINKKVYFHK